MVYCEDFFDVRKQFSDLLGQGRWRSHEGEGVDLL
jgi:hypothetical protein